MSNMSFDQLDKKIRLENAQETVAIYTQALSRPDLTEADVEWLNRAVAAAKTHAEAAQRRLQEWWS